MRTYEAIVRVTFILDAPDDETGLALVDWACKNAQWTERHRWERLVVIADGDDIDTEQEGE